MGLSPWRIDVRRRLLVLFGVFALLALGAGVAVVLPRPSKSISRENCEQIQPGMMESQVEEILGLPDGDYTSGWVTIVAPPILVMGPLPPPWKDWGGGMRGPSGSFSTSPARCCPPTSWS